MRTYRKKVEVVVKVDGLGPKDIAKIRVAIRKVWSWSHPRKLVLKRVALGNDYYRCEGCLKKVPKVYVDHITAVGDVDGGFIARLFCSSSGLQALCKRCHDLKTKLEREEKSVGF